MAAFKVKKLIRGGKLVKKKVRVSGRGRRQTPAQKRALAKARRKAHSGAASKKRSKSLVLRKRRGLDSSEIGDEESEESEGLEDEESSDASKIPALISRDRDGFTIEFELNNKWHQSASLDVAGATQLLRELDVQYLDGVPTDSGLEQMKTFSREVHFDFSLRKLSRVRDQFA